MNRKLSNLLLNVTMPLLIITSFQFPIDTIKNAPTLIIIAIFAHLLGILTSFVVYRKRHENRKNVLSFAATFSNCAFIGYPIIKSLYGEAGVFYTSMYVLIFNVFVWTYGQVLFNEKLNLKNLKKTVVNPGIISIVIGLFLCTFSIKIPDFLFKPMDMIGAMTTPLSMMITGVILVDINYRQMFADVDLYIGILLRLVVLPGILLVTLWALHFNGTAAMTMVIVCGLPVAMSTVLFTEKYNGDSRLSSSLIAMSTLVSMVTLPLLISVTTFLLK
jgi:predicted permease